MKISSVKIKNYSWEKWLIWFAEVIVDDSLFLWWIWIFARLADNSKIRLVFPTRKKDELSQKIFYPMNNELYYELEMAIQNEINKYGM
jgi:DNA-binding cell septation regulator SpoVG